MSVWIVTVEKMDINNSKLDSNGWTVTVENLTIIVDFHVNTIYKNIKELSHTNACTLRY